jgi:hypothetical protein
MRFRDWLTRDRAQFQAQECFQALVKKASCFNQLNHENASKSFLLVQAGAGMWANGVESTGEEAMDKVLGWFKLRELAELDAWWADFKIRHGIQEDPGHLVNQPTLALLMGLDPRVLERTMPANLKHTGPIPGQGSPRTRKPRRRSVDRMSSRPS